MSDDCDVYALSADLPPLTVDGLWKKIVRYLAQGSGDPCVRRILEETLFFLADLESVHEETLRVLADCDAVQPEENQGE
jgi:hypothetical protein